MSNLKEIRSAIKILKESGLSKKKLTLLHCISEYPTPLEKLNLNFLSTLKKEFKLNIGFSDHSKSLISPVIAVALGSKIIEKHLTLDCNMNGPDHSSSLNPNEFKEMVKFIREAEKSTGNKKKIITKIENKNKKIVRKSIVAKIDILKGQKFTMENLDFKRPGYGISPMQINKIIGRKAKKNYRKDDLI